MVQPGVVELMEQQRVHYLSNGILRTHYLDLVLRFRNGNRVAFSIKYEEDREKSDLNAELQAVSDYEGDRVANAYRILREENVNLLEFKNAEQIISCAKDHDVEAQQAVRNCLPKMGKLASPRDIGSFTRLGRRGERAAIALLQSGILELREHAPIHPDAVFIISDEYKK